MAIVIKVKADTKELEKDIKQAGENAKKALDQATASAGTGRGASGFAKLTDEFKRQRTEADALRGRVEELKKSSAGLIDTLGASTVRWIAYGGAIAFAKKHTIDMVQETAKLNDELLETSLKTGKTAEKMQDLVKGGRDLTGQLRSLGAVLSYETIKKASEATDQFALLDKQLFAIQTRITAEMSDALQGLGRALNEAMERVGPIVVRMATQVGNGIESILPLLETTLGILVRINELQEKVGLPFTGTLGRRAFEALTPAGPAPSRTATLALGHEPSFAARGEFRDFLRSPITHERLLENRRRARPPRAARAPDIPDLPFEAVDGLRILNQVLSQLEENARGAAAGIAAMNARTLQVLEGRARLRGQLEDIPTFTAEQAGLTTGVDDTRIRRQIREAELEEQFKVFEEVRNQAIRFKQSIVFTFESAFREGFEKGPKAFLQATAAAIKSFFSQIAAELSTGIIELILFGKGGITGRGVGTSGTLGGLGAAVGGFGRTGASFAGFGGGGGGGGGIGGFISKFLGGGGTSASQISVAPSLSGVAGGDFAGSLLSISQGGTVAGGTAAGVGGGGLFGGIGGLSAIAGPALLGGLLGSGLGGSSLGGKILGGIGGGIAGIGVASGLAVGLAGGGLGFGLLAATGWGLLAAPFLIGAIYLGKAKQRRADEQLADSIWVAERDQIRTLISAVNADRIEGYDALSQWSAIRSNTVSQLQQIKTESVRTSRLTNQLRDLDNSVVAELRSAVERQARRRGVSGMLVPEFQGGGYVPGINLGRDSVLAKVQPGELVLTQAHQSRLKQRAGPTIFEEVGIPNQKFQYGGMVQAQPSGLGGPIVLELHIDEGVTLGRIQSNAGQQVIVKTVKRARLNNEL